VVATGDRGCVRVLPLRPVPPRPCSARPAWRTPRRTGG